MADQHVPVIESIGLYRLSIPLKKPFIISLGTIEAADNIVVKIVTDTGLTGFGESSPFMTINGENQDTGMIMGEILAKLLNGKPALDIAAAIDTMDRAVYGNSSIKGAFDTALHDIAAQHAGIPLYKFFGAKPGKKLFTDYTVSIGKPEQMAADALLIKEEGYPVIKVKVGGNGEEDVERIASIRKTIGKKLPIRIDANQGWLPATAAKTLKAMESFNIQYCEEPIPRWAFMELKKLRKKSPIPIMADESCCDDKDAERLIALGACDMFNLKLGKSGGLWKARKIIDLAEANKMPMQVGGFMESKITMTANAHLAMSSKLIKYCDFDTPLMFAEDPVTGGISYGKGGEVIVPETAGLGASISEEKLRSLPSVHI